MADLTMCQGGAVNIENNRVTLAPSAKPCPLRDICQRHIATPNAWGQSYSTFGPFDGTCENFIRGDKVNDKQITEKMLINFTEVLHGIERHDLVSIRHSLITVGKMANALALSPTLIENYAAQLSVLMGAHKECVLEAFNKKQSEEG